MSTHRPVKVEKNSVLVGNRNRLNLIEGTNIGLTMVDDSANDEIDVTINGSPGTGATYCRYVYQVNGADAEAVDATTNTVVAGGSADVAGVNGADHAAVYQWILNTLNTQGGGGVYGRKFSSGVDYTWGTTISIPNSRLAMIFEAETRIESTAAVIMDGAAVAWTGGDLTPPRSTLENVEFSHEVVGAGDIGLDLRYTYMSLRNVKVSNADNTDLGTGIIAGPKLCAGGTPCIWENVSVFDYDVGFDISMDHINLTNPVAAGCSGYGFYIHNAGWMTLVNPFVTNQNAAGYPYGFDTCDTDIILINPSHETASVPYIFYYTNVNHIVAIFGFSAYQAGSPIRNTATGIRILSTNKSYRTCYSGAMTITAGNTSVDETHGLVVTPEEGKINITPLSNLGGKSWWISNVTSTQFRINISAADAGNLNFEWGYNDFG